MKASMLAMLAVLFSAISILHNTPQASTSEDQETIVVESVYLTQENGILTVRDAGNGTHIVRQFYGNVRMSYDVPAGNNPWIRTVGLDYEHKTELFVHLHSLDDLHTSGWNHGKFGRGTINRID